MTDIDARDFLDNPIQIGDRVVFMQLHYRNLMYGNVIKIAPRMVTIKHNKTNTCRTQTKQFHNQVVVVKE